jgi:hypothetical protein
MIYVYILLVVVVMTATSADDRRSDTLKGAVILAGFGLLAPAVASLL